MSMTRGQRVSVGRESVKGIFLRSRPPFALVLLDTRKKPSTFLLSLCKPVTTNTAPRGTLEELLK